MPRKKTQAQLDAMPTKNQQTQCNTLLLFKDSRDFGVQAFERSDLVSFESNRKGLVKEYVIAQTQTDAISFSNTEIQTEIFGFKVPFEKWEEINFFSITKLLKRPQKRKLINNNLCTSDDECQSKRLTLEDSPKPASLSTQGTFATTNVRLSVKETATEDFLPQSPGTINRVLDQNVVLPSAISALKEYMQASCQGGIYTRILKTRDGLTEYLEVTLEDGLLPVSNYHDVPRRLLFSSMGKLSIVTLFKAVKVLDYFNLENGTLILEIVINAMASLNENYVFCTGIPKETAIGMENTKNIQRLVYPFERIQSMECLAWFVPPANASKDKIRNKLYQCSKCGALNRYMTNLKKKKDQVTPRTKLKRRSVDSRCRISVLTPKSKKHRLEKSRHRRSALVRKAKELEKKLIETSLQLSKDQDNEMKQIVSEINSRGKKDLEDIFDEAYK